MYTPSRDCLTTIELCLREIQSFLGRAKESSEDPKLAIVFPVVSDQFVNTVQNLVAEKYKSLVTVVVNPSNENANGRLIVVTANLIEEKILKECMETQSETSSDYSKLSLIYCEKQDCTGAPLNSQSNEGALNDIAAEAAVADKVKDAHLHCSQYGTNFVIRQPLSDSDWQQLGKSQLIEIAEIAGPVTLIKPEWNKTLYNQEIFDFSSGHIIEIYDFSSSWSTKDLYSAWYDFKQKGFKIERSDTTHALVVFKDNIDACSALTVMHPSFKSRPAVLCSEVSRQHINKFKDIFLPFKERPKKNLNVAKRLISQSLGISNNCSSDN